MLQKSEKGVYNRLSRRQVLKALGILSLVGGLTGCSSLLKDQTLRSSNTQRFIPLSKEQRLAQAFANLDKKLLHKAMKQMKKSLKTYKGGGSVRTAVKEAREVLKELFTHFNNIGLTIALQENAPTALAAYSELPNEAINFLRDADITESEIQELRSRVQMARNELLPKASNLHLGQMMNNIIAQLKMIESYQASSTMVPVDFWKWVRCAGSALVTIGTGVATAAACASCAAEPTKLSCVGCAGGAIATLGAAALTAAECLGS